MAYHHLPQQVVRLLDQRHKITVHHHPQHMHCLLIKSKFISSSKVRLVLNALQLIQTWKFLKNSNN